MVLMPEASAPGAAPASVGVSAPATQAEAERDGEQADKAEALRQKTRAELMRQIAEQVDFPSIQASIRRLRQTARDEQAHLSVLSDMVLNDVGLTGKLLRIVNAAFYSTAGAGTITSMHRAVALVGVDSLELLAATLMVFDRVPRGRDGEAVRSACGAALLSGWLAQQLCQSPKQLDAVYLNALFMNLGEMLVAMHAPGPARRIQRKAQDLHRQWLKARSEAQDTPGAAVSSGGLTPADFHDIKQRAARDVLGITLEELGCEVARQWGWPDALVQQLRTAYPVATGVPLEVGSPTYLRALCTAATDWAAALQAVPADAPASVLEQAQRACVERFQHNSGALFRVDPAWLAEVGSQALEQRDSIASFLALSADDPPPASARPTAVDVFKPKPPPVWTGPNRIAQGLDHALHGLQESDDWASSMDEVIEQLMVDLMEAMRLQRVVVCLRHPASGALCGVAGLGVRAPQVVECFQVPLPGGTDLFSLLCRHGKAALISDAADPVVWRTLPVWFTQKVGARTFVLLPMVHQGVAQGLVYADRQMAGSLVLNEREFALLETVRDQLLATLVSRGHTA